MEGDKSGETGTFLKNFLLLIVRRTAKAANSPKVISESEKRLEDAGRENNGRNVRNGSQQLFKSFTNDINRNPIHPLRLVRFIPGASNFKTEAMTLYVLLIIGPFVTAAVAIIIHGWWCNRQMEKKHPK